MPSPFQIEFDGDVIGRVRPILIGGLSVNDVTLRAVKVSMNALEGLPAIVSMLPSPQLISQLLIVSVPGSLEVNNQCIGQTGNG